MSLGWHLSVASEDGVRRRLHSCDLGELLHRIRRTLSILGKLRIECELLWMRLVHGRGAVDGDSSRGFGATTLKTFPSVHAAVPPVLDCVITAAVKATRNFSPSLAHFVYHAFDHLALLRRDGAQVEGRLEVLMIPLTTLLGGAELNDFGYAHPIVRTMLLDKLEKVLVLCLRPGASAVFLACCGHDGRRAVGSRRCSGHLVTRRSGRRRTRKNDKRLR